MRIQDHKKEMRRLADEWRQVVAADRAKHAAELDALNKRIAWLESKLRVVDYAAAVRQVLAADDVEP